MTLLWGRIALLAHLLAQGPLVCISFRSCCHQLFWSNGLADTFHSKWCCDSASCLAMDKSDPWANKTLHLRIQMRQICTLPSSLVRVRPQFGPADGGSHWWNYYLSPVGINLVCQDPIAGVLEVLHLPPPLTCPPYLPVRFPTGGNWRFPGVPMVHGPLNDPKYQGRLVLWVFFSHWRI